MVEAVSIDDFLSENQSALKELAGSADEALGRTAVKMPPKFHREIQKGLLGVLLQYATEDGPEKRPTVRLAIDSNIIVADAFAVAKGKPSRAPRVFESPYLELYAPRKIVEEVERSVVEDLPRGADLELAQSHARRLLARVKLVGSFNARAKLRASELIELKDPDDVPFLAVAIEYGSDAILSRDMKSIGTQTEVPTWKLGKGMRAVASWEKGSLSLAVGASSAELALRALERVALVIANAFEEVLQLIVEFLAGLAGGVVNAVARLPEWAAMVIIGALALGTFLFISSEGFRERVAEGVTRVVDFLSPYMHRLVQAASALVEILKGILVLCWNYIVLPVGSVLIVGSLVLIRNIRHLIHLCESQASRRAV